MIQIRKIPNKEEYVFVLERNIMRPTSIQKK